MDQHRFHMLKENIIYFLHNLEDVGVDYKCESDSSFFPQPKILPKLNNVVDDLLHYLKMEVDIDIVIKQLPECGQLLGRLCRMGAVTLEPRLYTSLMKCLIVFYTRTSDTQLAVKAKKWALGQIHNMISVPATDYGLLERLGMNHSQIKSAEVSQVLTEILRCIRKKNCQKTNRCTPLRLDTSVKSVVNSLFCAAHMTELSVLWEAVLDLLACCTTEDKDVLEIYQMLTDTQCSAYITDTRVLLTPKACLSLWSSYLPSLEIEVLRMIDATTSCLMLPCCVKKLINSRHLPYCCAVRPQIFHTVLHMLHTMLAKSAGNGKVTEVITQFCQCVWEQSMSLSDSQQMLYPLCRVYSASLQPLINLFSVQPADLSCDAAAHHVKQITQFLHGIHDNSTTGTDSMLQLCLLHHRPWYSKAVLVCLQCSRKFIEPCVELMMWFHWTQDQNKLAQLKKHTNSVISLHPLLLKGTLKETDIQYAVTATEKFESDHIIVGHILMAFLFLSVTGMHVAQFILKLVTDSDSPCQHLLTLLMSQQQLMIDLSSLSTHTLGNYKELLVDLRSKVKPVDCSGEVKTLSFEQYQTLLNVVSDTLNDVQQILSPSGSRELDISQWR